MMSNIAAASRSPVATMSRRLRSRYVFAYRRPQTAISLVELLIVVAIISLLLQMTLPAIEMSRESARQLSCENNVRQLAVAAQLHLSTHSHFPTGGWTCRWVGDPNRGFGSAQPGGWCYNLLPFLEYQDLHDMGKAVGEPERRAAGRQMFATPVPVYVCPSRRLARAWPYSLPMHNIYRPKAAGRSDYAANIGDDEPSDQRKPGPKTYAEADKWVEGTDPHTQWVATHHNGIISQRSTVKPREISDGLSKTYLFGEKFLSQKDYHTGKSFGDDQGLCVGFDRDVVRTTNRLHPPMKDSSVDSEWLETGDSEQVLDWNFGSSHPNTFNMSRCDGSVDRISYDIDMEVFSTQGSRGN